MLLEMAIGDAYGAGFEFADRDKITRYNDLTAYHEHGLGIAPGHYTDDTQMSLALAELIIEGGSWDKHTITRKFIDCFKRDQRLGYSKGFYAFLDSISNADDFLAKIKVNSVANGAAMRSVPIGLFSSVDEVLHKAEIQASITHNTSIGINSSQAVALASHYFYYKLGPKAQLGEFVQSHTDIRWNTHWHGEVACCGYETVNALLTVLLSEDSYSALLIQSVAFGGDVDTIAACALGIASLSEEYKNDLPRFLYDELENNDYGKDYLIERARQLHSALQASK
ncbi:ADP-ribosylglycohydrolase family protein [Pseudoalteromonas luteoviolacea]|uniref:ADP-ribosylglycohydrolase family protein n=1 Tax=Pseudoalteromonas luteoviolacea TaxID=43657 RepID=UPI001B3860C7|nr:ADP-ribosylglycohydrolase family protein [Pseudoalteromonas luteoviolacea]MBQ4811184.1 ADP-ribosylglycohydrolase family protein [Pseudoalteromonas luteoviolacea]